MREDHLRYLRCPYCTGELRLTADGRTERRIETGPLHCENCSVTFPIVGFIPRFVPVENYATSFGVSASERRFFEETQMATPATPALLRSPRRIGFGRAGSTGFRSTVIESTIRIGLCPGGRRIPVLRSRSDHLDSNGP
jgi:uncharacterized protein YbaR (Trm112 family)